MARLRGFLVAFALLAALLLAVRHLAPELRSEGPRADVVFAAFGDSPYLFWQRPLFDQMMGALARDSLDFALHVGDLFWQPCSTELMKARRKPLLELPFPVVYSPGDNEWTDCWSKGSGGYDPLERLDSLRSIFFDPSGWTLGSRPRRVQTQSSRAQWPEFVEHQRWFQEDIAFATLHLVGSWNGRAAFAGRGERHDAEVDRRTSAAVEWMRETMRLARARQAPAVVFFGHDYPDPDAGDPSMLEAYQPFPEALAEEALGYEGEILYVQGDDHDYLVDQPVRDREGRVIDNVTRLKVMGSPTVGWVRVGISRTEPRFDFRPRTVPLWRVLAK